MKINRDSGLRQNKPNTNPKQTQSVVSLPALPALSAVEGSLFVLSIVEGSKGSNLFQRQKKCCRPLLTGCGGRFLLTKLAFFYSIVLLETNIYNRLRLFELSDRKPPISWKTGHGGHRRYYRNFKAERKQCGLAA